MSDSMVPAPVFSVRMVGELKGAPLSCLILLAMSNQPVSNEWLCMMSGYTDKPVALALKKLSSPEFQMARRAFGGWVINGVMQLPFELSDISRNNSVPTTTTLLRDININKDSVVVASRNFSDSSKYDENMAACKQTMIWEPAASMLSVLEHVTPDFIVAHVESLLPGQTRGLAILRIKNNELPSTWEAGARSAAEAAAVGWRYSDAFLSPEKEAE